MCTHPQFSHSLKLAMREPNVDSSYRNVNICSHDAKDQMDFIWHPSSQEKPMILSIKGPGSFAEIQINIASIEGLLTISLLLKSLYDLTYSSG